MEIPIPTAESTTATARPFADQADLMSRSAAEEISFDRIQQLNQLFECFGANVIVSRYVAPDEVTPGGVIKKKLTRSQEAIVVLSGPGEWLNGTFIPNTVQAGQHVLVTKHGGTDVELDGETLLLLHMKQVYVRRK